MENRERAVSFTSAQFRHLPKLRKIRFTLLQMERIPNTFPSCRPDQQSCRPSRFRHHVAVNTTVHLRLQMVVDHVVELIAAELQDVGMLQCLLIQDQMSVNTYFT